MTILDQIIADKRREVELAKINHPISKLKSSAYFNRERYSFKESLDNNNGPSIIAEFKRKSPSKDFGKSHLTTNEICPNYQINGAGALSILTDHKYFGGSNEDVCSVRDKITIPILRKDFIIDSYQIHEAKSIGADCILLIASCLQAEEIAEFTRIAHDLDLEVLLELHGENEIDKISLEIDAIGINNRNLSTFTTDYNHSLNMLAKLPDEIIKVSESGINSHAQIDELYTAGFKAFLIGGHFMQCDDPATAFRDFITTLNHAHVN